VIINEDHKGTSGGDVKFAGRGHKSGNKAEEITEEDEESYSSNQREILLPFFSDGILQKILESFDDELEDALTFRRHKPQPSRRKAEEKHETCSHKEAHHDIVRKEMFWILDIDSYQCEQGGKRLSDDFIEEVDDD